MICPHAVSVYFGSEEVWYGRPLAEFKGNGGTVNNKPLARLYLFGVPCIETVAGRRVHISSKKGMALLATIATADRLERSRVWLQELLWGSRGQRQAQSSLRREVFNLRFVLAEHNLDILKSDHRRIGFAEGAVLTDLGTTSGYSVHRQFCEGLDLANEEAFEEWLREMRSFFDEQAGARRRTDTL